LSKFYQAQVYKFCRSGEERSH